MKPHLLLLLLLSLSLFIQAQPYEPGILLGKSPMEVSDIYQNYPDYQRICKSDTLLSFYNWKQDIIASYTFTRYKHFKYCHKCTLIIDCMRGEELIALHHRDWECYNDLKWLYHVPSYGMPILVSLTYTQDTRMQFDYTLLNE